MEPKTSIKNIKLDCPCCGNTSKNNSEVLSRQIRYLVEHRQPWYAWNGWVQTFLAEHKGIHNNALGSLLKEVLHQPNLFQLLKSHHFQWACDDCLQNGKAMDAVIEKQTYCDFPPYLAYFDKHLECSACHQPFVYSKEEQQFWYEELKFWVQAIPKNYKACRKKIREQNKLNTKLQHLLKNLNKQNAKQLIEISQLYMEMGKYEKGKHYETLAKRAFS